MKKNHSIVYLRSMATILVFFCHILLVSGYEKSSMWLNVGVQIFFIMSAYLLTAKQLDSFKEIKRFMINRCKKLFPPYWIYIIGLSIVLIFVHRQPNLKNLLIYLLGLKGFFESANILGLGHLWFVTVILVCYLLMPVFYKISLMTTFIKKISVVFVAIIISCVMSLIQCYSYAVYIISYMISYLYFRKCKGTIKRKDLIVWVIMAIIFSMLRLFVDNSGIEVSKWYYMYDAICVPIFKTFLGMGIVVIYLYFERFFYSVQECKWVEKFSDLSYEFYIAHQFIQLALWKFVPWYEIPFGIAIWITMCLVLSFCNAWILSLMANKLMYIKIGRKKCS